MLGTNEFFIIFIVVLFIFGPQKIPEFGKFIGTAIGEFKKAQKIAEITSDFDVNVFDKYKNKKIINSNVLKTRIYNIARILNIKTENKDIEEILSLIFDNIESKNMFLEKNHRF